MKVKYKPVLWLKDADKDNKCPIAICITGGGKRTYYNTGIKVHPDYWDGAQIKKGVDNYDIKNARISGMIKDAEREILNTELQGGEITLDIAKKMLNPTKVAKGNFTKFYRSYIDGLIETNKKAYSTIQIWETQYSQFKEFAGENMPYSQVTADWLNKFHKWLITPKEGQEPYKPTTIFKKLKRIRQIIKQAIELGHIDKKQMAGFEMVKNVEPETDYLTLEQVQKIADKVFSGEYDYDPELRKVAAFFLVECLGGIRYSDWHKFEVETLINARKFKVRAAKNNEPIYLDLAVFTSLDKVLTYIKKNKLVFDITNQATNRILKQVGRDLKLKFPLKTHDGRRTFGTLLGEMSYSTRFIAEAMGITERTAQRYVKVTRKSLENEMALRGGF